MSSSPKSDSKPLKRKSVPKSLTRLYKQRISLRKSRSNKRTNRNKKIKLSLYLKFSLLPNYKCSSFLALEETTCAKTLVQLFQNNLFKPTKLENKQKMDICNIFRNILSSLVT